MTKRLARECRRSRKIQQQQKTSRATQRNADSAGQGEIQYSVQAGIPGSAYIQEEKNLVQGGRETRTHGIVAFPSNIFFGKPKIWVVDGVTN